VCDICVEFWRTKEARSPCGMTDIMRDNFFAQWAFNYLSP
jgi:hypothetical protein